MRLPAYSTRSAPIEDRPTLGIDPFVLWGRASVVGLLGLVLGVSGHVATGGNLPTPDLVVVLAASAVVASAALLLHQASARRLISMLAAAQGILHVTLMAADGDHAAGATHGVMVMPMAPGSPAMSGAAPGTSLPGMAAHLGAHLPMVAAHLVAAVLVGLWLAHGERCLWSVMTLVFDRRILLLAVLALVALVPRASLPRIVCRRRVWGPRSIWLIRPDSLRGPPRLEVRPVRPFAPATLLHPIAVV